jgi:hypothetical protein
VPWSDNRLSGCRYEFLVEACPASNSRKECLSYTLTRLTRSFISLSEETVCKTA